MSIIVLGTKGISVKNIDKKPHQTNPVWFTLGFILDVKFQLFEVATSSSSIHGFILTVSEYIHISYNVTSWHNMYHSPIISWLIIFS